MLVNHLHHHQLLQQYHLSFVQIANTTFGLLIHIFQNVCKACPPEFNIYVKYIPATTTASYDSISCTSSISGLASSYLLPSLGGFKNCNTLLPSLIIFTFVAVACAVTG